MAAITPQLEPRHDLPPVPRLRQLVGPSFVILALGLGSGEVILWPYLSANYGLGIVWGAALGITFQFFLNMEIERYALVTGESVFVGFERRWRALPLWFIVSTFLGFGLPGIIAASAKVFGALIGWNHPSIIASLALVFIGLILSLGKTVYGTMERLTKTIILIAVPFIFILAFAASDLAAWSALAHGLVGRGEGFHWLPTGVSLATFLAAFAYAGAGGNLNLTQSIYVREKGYGMGVHSQKLTGLFRQHGHQELNLTGTMAPVDEVSVARFHSWWRRMNQEHLFVFWGLGLISILLLSLLAYVTTYGTPDIHQGISFVITEGVMLGGRFGGLIGGTFLLAVAIMLFQTQLGVMDSCSRIMSENIALMIQRRRRTNRVNLGRLYAGVLWAQIAFGILLFALGLSEPKSLIVTGAVINAVAMTVHIAFTTLLNRRALPHHFQPRAWRRAVMAGILAFFVAFSAYTLYTTFIG